MNKLANKTLSKKALKEIVARIVKSLAPDKIILFGSYAYGRPDRNSDVDLFVILESNERPAKRRMRVSQLFWDRQIPMDFIVKTPSEVDERLGMGDFFIRKIMEKGMVLYEKKTFR